MSEEVCSVRRKYSCHKCGNTYKRKSHFNRHVNLECGIEPQFCCPYCPNRYRRKNTLFYHIRRHHGTHMWLSNTSWRLEIFAFFTHVVYCKQIYNGFQKLLLFEDLSHEGVCWINW
jgi:hypothetical protein